MRAATILCSASALPLEPYRWNPTAGSRMTCNSVNGGSCEDTGGRAATVSSGTFTRALSARVAWGAPLFPADSEETVGTGPSGSFIRVTLLEGPEDSEGSELSENPKNMEDSTPSESYESPENSEQAEPSENSESAWGTTPAEASLSYIPRDPGR